MKEFVCIVCPSSCHLRVEEIDNELCVSGNSCGRGREHGMQEYTMPKRMLTSTIAVIGGILPRLSVISTAEIPRSLMSDCLNALYQMEIEAPIKCGDVIAYDLCGSGVDIVASRSMASI